MSCLSKDFGLSAQVDLLDEPEGILKDAGQGYGAVDLQAQSLVSDFFYYLLPRTDFFLLYTEPAHYLVEAESGTTRLDFLLREELPLNIKREQVLQDIKDLLKKICNDNANCAFDFSCTPEDDRSKLLCQIVYNLEDVAPVVSKWALKFYPDDEQVRMRADLLTHILERRNGNGRGYIPANKLN